MKTWVKVLLVIVAVLIIGAFSIFLFGTIKKGEDINTSPPPNFAKSSSDVTGFEQKKSSNYYTVYYHTNDDTNADKTLDVLDKAVSSYYQKYLGITPQNTSVYLASTVDEYVQVAKFPGGAQNVQVGDGSAPEGKIYLYKPFDDPNKGRGVIVHEATHAALWGFLGGGQAMEKIPGFLNEGLAYHMEYINNAGANYDPLKEIYYSDLLTKAAKSGNPPLMSLEDLGKNCEGYISNQNLNGLCRGQGTFTVWYMQKNFGTDFWAKFLADLKTSDGWQKSLEKVTAKSSNQLGQEIDNALKDMVK